MIRNYIIAAGVVAIITLLAFQLFVMDGVLGLLGPLVFTTETVYASGYSDRGFRRIRVGMTESDVRAMVGEPLSEVWEYGDSSPGCGFVRIEHDRVATNTAGQECKLAIVTPHMSGREVTDVRGHSASQLWIYSSSPTGNSYRERVVYLKHGIVIRKNAGLYID